MPTSPDSSATSEVPEAEIAAEVRNILRGLEPPATSLPLATIGHRLSAKLRRPLRKILGERKLREIIDRLLNEKIAIDGPFDRLTARLISEENKANIFSRFRYDPVFWAAFAKPIAEGKRRFIKIDQPFDMKDVSPEETAESDWYEIGVELIPPSDVPRQERQSAILVSISKWCNDNKLSCRRFVNTVNAHRSPPSSFPESNPGAAALIRMIDVIPEGERAKYSIGLDLVHKLLTSR